MSENVKDALRIIQTHFEYNGGITIFCEGDSLLASSEKPICLSVDMLIHENISFSAGIGKSTAVALLALKKAKGLGKKRVEVINGELK